MMRICLLAWLAAAWGSCPTRWGKYTVVTDGTNKCPSGTAIETNEECKAAMVAHTAACPKWCTSPSCDGICGRHGGQPYVSEAYAKGPYGCYITFSKNQNGNVKYWIFSFNTMTGSVDPHAAGDSLVCMGANLGDALPGNLSLAIGNPNPEGVIDGADNAAYNGCNASQRSGSGVANSGGNVMPALTVGILVYIVPIHFASLSSS